MLVYDWLWWGQLTNQNLAWRCAEVRRDLHGGLHGGLCRGALRCTEVHRGAWRGAWRCMEVHRGAWRYAGDAWICMEGCTEVRGGVCGGP